MPHLPIFSTLPTDALIHTLSFLDDRELLLNVSLVCRMLRDLSYSSLQRLTVIGDENDILKLVQRHSSIQSLEVHFSHRFDHEHWSNLLFSINTPPLERLTISNCRNLTRIGNSTAGSVSPLIQRVKHLEILQCRGLSHMDPWKSLMNRLENVDLSGSTVTSEFVQKLVNSNPNLRFFKASQNSGITTLRLHSKFLETLILDRCAHLQDVFLHCPELRTLDLSRTSMSDSALGIILDDSHGNYFNQEMCHLPNLHTLKLDGCKRLERPYVSHSNVVNLSMCRLSNMSRPTLSCPALRSIDMDGASSLTDQNLEIALSGCARLQELRLTKCTSLKNVVLPECVSSNLLLLDLTFSTRVESLSFRTTYKVEQNLDKEMIITPSSPIVQELILNWTSITDNSLSSIVQQCHMLRSLSLHGVDTLKNPNCIVASNSLSSINFSGCHNLESPVIRSPKRSGVKLLLDMCRSLRSPVVEYIEDEKISTNSRRSRARRRLVF